MKKNSYQNLQSEWVQAYESGESLRSIAIRYGVDHSNVRYWVKKTCPIRPKHIPQERILLIQELYEQGLTRKEIGAKLNLSASSISDVLNQHLNLSYMKRQPKYQHLDSEIKYRYESGQSIKWIAKELNLCDKTVSDALTRQQVSRRSHHEVSRIYWIDDSFWQILDAERSYDLGVFWATTSVFFHNGHGLCSLRFSTEKETEVLAWLNRFTEMTPDRFYYRKGTRNKSFEVRLYSTELAEKLSQWGLGWHLPLSPQLEEAPFWQGFWIHRVRLQPSKKALMIRFESERLMNQCFDWLFTNGVSLKKWSTYRSKETQSFQVTFYRQSTQAQLVCLFPFLAPLIQEVSSEWWNKVSNSPTS